MLAIIGGSGLTRLSTLAVAHREVVRTPYGEPSSALLYGQILQAAGQGIWVIHDGRTRYANRRMEEIGRASCRERVFGYV